MGFLLSLSESKPQGPTYSFLEGKTCKSSHHDELDVRKGYSVLRAKKEIRQAQEAARREKAEASASSTGMMFVPMEPPTIDLPMEDLLYGINITFPNGTLVSVKKGCAKSVMALMKLYEKEDAGCLD